MASKIAPKSQLKLEWVYGYRGHQCRNNLYYTANKDVVYFVAGVAIVYNSRDHKQKFFLGHDDDITSLALHPERQLVATGQVGKNPYICVWDSHSLQTLSILKGGHQAGISTVAFDKDGSRLVSVGLDESQTMSVWDWKKAKVISTVSAHNDRVFDAQFNIFQENILVSCGVKHIKFWTLCGNTLTAKKGVFGKVGEMQTLLCLGFRTEATYSGTLAGDVYVWRTNNLQSVIPAAHKGPLYTIDMGDEGYATGGKDGCCRLWDADFKPISSVDVTKGPDGYTGLSIRSVCWRGDRILVGTQGSEIFEIGINERDKATCLVQGHAEGELWALAVHPKKPIFATGSDDQTLRLWNATNHEVLSKTSLDHKIRSCAFDNDGSQLAVGLMDGSFMVLSSRDLSEIVHLKDRKEVLHEMKYSPCGKFIAVGSNDNFVDIYSVEQRYKKVGTCSGSSSFITHVDWSDDSKYLQTNSGAAERLFYKMPGGKRITSQEEIEAIHWVSFTGVLGSEVNGIWEKYTDTNDVNALDANFGAEVAVTGDDFGLVKLFKFPSLRKGAKFRKYTGHSSHVTNVRFTHDKQRVVTTGGADHAVFQWRFSLEGFPGGADGDTVDASAGYVDSDSEGSDSDLSDVGDLDSDLEREKQMSYGRSMYREDAAKLSKMVKVDMTSGVKRNAPPTDSLKLQFIHGYRGYDCRNNLFYCQSGEVVYHVAAAGVVYNREKHTQRFYVQHTDDILCLSIHPLKDYVATGQVGRDPAIHVWDTDTMATVSILKGQHERGVCAVDFSADGKKLASVGLDDNHCIVVWDWRRGDKLATTRGHKDKIFVIKWNPLDNARLVTVGVKHLKFWTQTGGGFTSTRGTFGNVSKQCDMLCVVYGKTAETCFTGGSDGNVFVWEGVTLQKTVKAHEGPCFAMHSLDKGFVTGGKDGIVCLWDDLFDRCLKTYSLKRSNIVAGSRGQLVSESPAIRAIVLGHGKILVGTRNGEVIEVDKAGPMVILTQGHTEGELWGLVTHPIKNYMCTVSDDRTLRVWDMSKEHKLVNVRHLKVAGRCVDFSPDGKAIAVGLKDGSFVVVNSDTLEDIVSQQHRKEEISDIKFSPGAGKYLAVASHDNFVDIYSVLNNKRVGVCKGASSYITHIDWDMNGKLLVVNSGAKEQLFFEAPRGTRVTMKSSEVMRQKWHSWTGVLGASCEGVWPPRCDVTDVNATCLTNNGRLLATADDFGFVKLFNYPATGKHSKYKKYCGHSAHVTNVRWSHDDALLVTVGGADTAVMVWAHSGEGEAHSGDSGESGTESDNDTGYDSDVEREKSVDYVSKTYPSQMREKEGVKPHLQDMPAQDKPAVSRQAPEPPKVQRSEAPVTSGGKRKKITPVTDLSLDFIHGYRGFDARMNLFYINDAADVVFHAAGAGVVQNLVTGAQSFYLEHTDDILCLTTNQHPKYKNIVATGQIGQSPCVHVWDASTKQTLSIIKGEHSVGVACVDFSSTGKYLVSVGLETEHHVAVWRWQDGSKVASVPGHTARIFHAEFRPDSDTQFVTVGVGHVKFWTVTGNQLVGKRGVLSDAGTGTKISRLPTMLSMAFSANEVTYTGSMTGEVYVWKDTLLVRLVNKAHSGPVFSMFTTLRDGLIVTGGKEQASKESGPVKLWDQDMKRCRAFQLREGGGGVDVVKSVCRCKGKILVGTKDNTVTEIGEKNGTTQVLVSAHGEGEVWGLATHPSLHHFITASYDGAVTIWDIATKGVVGRLMVGPARSVAYSHDGDSIAVGLKSGEFMLLTSAALKLWAKKRDRASPVNDIRFSPDGKLLAVGCEEGCVDIYDLTQAPALRRISSCNGVPSFVVQMDFSADSAYLRVSTGAYIHQVFSVARGNLVDKPEVTKAITWSTWTSVLGEEVVGIWGRDSSNADVNCSHLSHQGHALATGDDFGLVKLFQFPCSEKFAPHKTFAGHSAHVTNVRFTYDDKYLVSTGGDDCSVFVWKCL